MLFAVCKWYVVVLYAVAAMLTIVKDGQTTTNYTGKYKLIWIIIQLPVWYFIYKVVVG